MTWHGNLAVDDAVALYEAMTGRRCDRERAHAQLAGLIDGGACPLYLLGRGRAGRGGWRPGRYNSDGKWIAGTRSPVKLDRLLRAQPDEGDADYQPSQDYDHTTLSQLLANLQGRRAALARLVVDEQGPSLATGGVVAGRALTGAELVDRAGWVNARALAELGRPLITIGEGGALVLAVDVPADLVPDRERSKAKPAATRRPPARASAPPARKRRPQARAASADDTLFDSMKRLRHLGQMRGGRVTLPSGDRRSGFLWRVAIRKTDRSCATWRDQAPHDDVVIGIVRTADGPLAVVDPGPAGVRFSLRGEIDEALRKVRAWSLGVADRDQPPAHHPAALQALLDGAPVDWPDGWASADQDDASGDTVDDLGAVEPAQPTEPAAWRTLVEDGRHVDRWSHLRKPPAGWPSGWGPDQKSQIPARDRAHVVDLTRSVTTTGRDIWYALPDGEVIIDHAPTPDREGRRFAARLMAQDCPAGALAEQLDERIIAPEAPTLDGVRSVWRKSPPPGPSLADAWSAAADSRAVDASNRVVERTHACGRPQALTVEKYVQARVELEAGGARASDGAVARAAGLPRSRLAARTRRMQIEHAATALEHSVGLSIGWGDGLGLLAGARVRQAAATKPAPDQAAPFLKYTGSKWRLLNELLQRELAAARGELYLETCIGGGAVLLELLHRGWITEAVACDRDPHLVELWQMVQVDPDGVYAAAASYPVTEEAYYRVRDELREVDLDPLTRAGRLLYLLRVGWNGLNRRRQRDGKFNAPWGQKDELEVTLERLRAVSAAVRRVVFVSGDLVDVIDAMQSGVIYADPPYWPASESKKFVGYDGRGFSRGDLARLIGALERARRRGCTVVMSNSAQLGVLELLPPGWRVRVLQRPEAMRYGGGQALEVVCSAVPDEAQAVAS